MGRIDRKSASNCGTAVTVNDVGERFGVTPRPPGANTAGNEVRGGGRGLSYLHSHLADPHVPIRGRRGSVDSSSSLRRRAIEMQYRFTIDASRGNDSLDICVLFLPRGKERTLNVTSLVR